MKRAGLPTPANHLIRSSADVAKAAEVVGFPAVIKPISGAASEGVVRVDSKEQLERCAPATCMLHDFPLYKNGITGISACLLNSLVRYEAFAKTPCLLTAPTDACRVYERERKKIKAKAIDSNTTALDEKKAEEEVQTCSNVQLV